MTVKEFYERIGGGYDQAMSQMRKEERVAKYLRMFLRDESFSMLKSAMESDDMQQAFAGAHTLKGVSANLALSHLNSLVSALTEDLRGGRDIPHAREAYPEVAACYDDVIKAITEFTEAQN